MRKLEKIDSLLMVSFITLVLFPLLYILRFLDDNTLTSWKWVFLPWGAERVFFLLFFGIILAFFISKSTLIEQYPALFLFLFSLLVIMPLWQGPEAILDASRYFIQAKYLSLYGIRYFLSEWGGQISIWTDLPLVPFLYGMIFKVFGEAREGIQFFTTIMFSLTVVLTYLIGKTLWDEERGFYGGLLLLGIPYLLTQAPLMLTDVPTMFFLSLSVYTYLRAVERGGLLLIASAICVVFLTMLTKYSAWIMLLILPVVSCVYYFRIRCNKILYHSALITGIVMILLAAVIAVKYNIFLQQTTMLRTYQWDGLSRWREGLASTFFFQSHPFISILALFGVAIAIRRRDIKFIIPGWFAVFVLLLQAARIRYILPLFPLLTLMASYGLYAIPVEREVKRFISYCAVASSLLVLFCAFQPFLNTTSMANLRDTGRYLDTLSSEAVKIHVLPQRTSAGNTEMAIPILDLFTKKRLIYTGHAFSVNSEGARQSPLRFTWEFKKPLFYSEDATDKDLPMLIISSDYMDADAISYMSFSENNFTVIKRFNKSSDVFRYKTFVTVLSKNPLSLTAQQPP